MKNTHSVNSGPPSKCFRGKDNYANIRDVYSFEIQ